MKWMLCISAVIVAAAAFEILVSVTRKSRQGTRIPALRQELLTLGWLNPASSAAVGFGARALRSAVVVTTRGYGLLIIPTACLYVIGCSAAMTFFMQ